MVKGYEGYLSSCCLPGLKTRRALVDFALRDLLRRENQGKIVELKGKIHWEGDLASIRRNLIFLPMTASIYRSLRARGITIRNSVDCMIAAACIEHEARLLHNDRDFDLLAAHSELQVIDISGEY